MGSLSHLEKAFGAVGWFIPPYMQLGSLNEIAAEIHAAKGNFSQTDLQNALGRLYGAEAQAAMVLHRYPIAPVIQEYRITIREAVEAHFLGLNHVAVAGLVPVVEGAGRRLAARRHIREQSPAKLFTALALDCRAEAAAHKFGAWDEVASMMDAFSLFARDAFFENSARYSFGDGTNRHGIAHGAFTDADFGTPINFYKTIAAIDFLTFIASFRANISWFAPSPTPESQRLAAYYRMLRVLRGEADKVCMKP